MSREAAIELKNITKRFGKVTANDKVCLSVRRGEILSVLGENGSGKTTLMNMISGIYYPDEGQIFVNGREVSIRSPKDSFALGIGMIHQHFKLVDVLTAAENIILGLPGREVLDMKAVSARIRELTERYGFELDPDQKIYTMSVSQKQTVEIVKLLYRGVDILILDEPTAVLTPRRPRSSLLCCGTCGRPAIPLSLSPTSSTRCWLCLTGFPCSARASMWEPWRRPRPRRLP